MHVQCATMVLLFATTFATTDLPVHCLHGQIVGRWKLHIGVPSSHHAPSCGMHTPGDLTDPTPDPATVVHAHRTYHIELSEPDLATGEDGAVGFWTMVYDEGFEIRLSGITYFAFSAFRRSSEPAHNAPLAPSDTRGYASECWRTGPGRYRVSNHSTAWGCFYATRDGRLSMRSQLGTVATALEDDQFSHTVRARKDARPVALKYAGLPSRWDWRDVDGVDYVSPGRVQGVCGSCYAIAAVSMLESRLAVATGGRERTRLSVQEVLSCSPYSQGCAGGFPYLVGKYLRDFGLPSDDCFPYRSAEKHVPCSARCSNNTRRWRAVDYRYVGGWYGSCNEAEMMHEIFARGCVGLRRQALLLRPHAHAHAHSLASA